MILDPIIDLGLSTSFDLIFEVVDGLRRVLKAS